MFKTFVESKIKQEDLNFFIKKGKQNKTFLMHKYTNYLLRAKPNLFLEKTQTKIHFDLHEQPISDDAFYYS